MWPFRRKPKRIDVRKQDWTAGRSDYAPRIVASGSIEAQEEALQAMIAAETRVPKKPQPDTYLSTEKLLSKNRLPNEVKPGLFRKCDQCGFFVEGTDPNVLDWALTDHFYRMHPTKEVAVCSSPSTAEAPSRRSRSARSS